MFGKLLKHPKVSVGVATPDRHRIFRFIANLVAAVCSHLGLARNQFDRSSGIVSLFVLISIDVPYIFKLVVQLVHQLVFAVIG